jgi:endonuclease III
LKHIHEVLKGQVPHEFDRWLRYHEIGPKTASLLLHAAFGTASALPTDSHVWYAFRRLKWTNARHPDECSWQSTKWMDPSYFVKTNDSIGSIRQLLAYPSTRNTLLQDVEAENNQRLRDLIQLLT